MANAILWLSNAKKSPFESQIITLRRYYGTDITIRHVQIDEWTEPHIMRSVFDAGEDLHHEGFQVVDVVYVGDSIGVLQKLTARGIFPLITQMRPFALPGSSRPPDLGTGLHRSWFNKFVRVTNVEFELVSAVVPDQPVVKKILVIRWRNFEASNTEPDELRRLFGADVQIEWEPFRIRAAHKIVTRFQSSGAQELLLMTTHATYRRLFQDPDLLARLPRKPLYAHYVTEGKEEILQISRIQRVAFTFEEIPQLYADE